MIGRYTRLVPRGLIAMIVTIPLLAAGCGSLPGVGVAEPMAAAPPDDSLSDGGTAGQPTKGGNVSWVPDEAAVQADPAGGYLVVLKEYKTGALVLRQFVAQPSLQVPPGVLKLGTKYKWRVRARVYGQYGAFSPWYVFTTYVPQAVLVEPSNGSTVADGTPTFRWNPAPEAEKYKVAVKNMDTLVKQTAVVTDTAYTVPATAALSPATYRWWVRVWADGQWRVPSDKWDFTVPQ